MMFEVWFIGGPWNNRLIFLGNLEPVVRAPYSHVEYYPDGQLRTGVPVYSCLWGPPQKPPARQE